MLALSLSISDRKMEIVVQSSLFATQTIVDTFLQNCTELRASFVDEQDDVFRFSNLFLDLQRPTDDERSIAFLTQCHLSVDAQQRSAENNQATLLFTDCNEYFVFDIFDRLIEAMADLITYSASHVILCEMQQILSEVHPKLGVAKIGRIGELCGSLHKELFDSTIERFLHLTSWSLSLYEAQQFLDKLKENIPRLILPVDGLELLVADLKPIQRRIIERRRLLKSSTLEELGIEFGLTRERVRQIEQKVVLKLRATCAMKVADAIVFTIRCLSTCHFCVSTQELQDFGIQERALAFITEGILEQPLLLPQIAGTDIIPFDDGNEGSIWLEHILNMLKAPPPVLSFSERDSFVREMAVSLSRAGYDTPREVVGKVAFAHYVENGRALVLKSLRLSDRYQIILERFFADGIRVYDKADMDRFRDHYHSIFDDDKISEHDRSVAVRIVDRCTLVARGRYAPTREIEIPDGLLSKIHRFIEDYPYDMVMTNAILHRFESELSAMGIGNKHYLSSILKKAFSNAYTFQRDYVLKGNSSGNFYQNIIAYLQGFPQGAGFAEIQEAFTGIPDSVLYFALSDASVVIPMYNKQYIHKDNILFEEQEEFFALLKEVVGRERIVADVRVYSLAKRHFPDFIANNNINTGWYLLSILRTFFAGEFKFSRPHIIDRSVDSSTGHEVLRESFWGQRSVSIGQLRQFAKEKNIYIYDLTKLMNSYNERYLILDKETLVHVDALNLNGDIIAEIETATSAALGDKEFAALSQLNIRCFQWKSDIRLTPWLIYAILNKYGTSLAVTTSHPKFNSAIPIVMRADIDGDYIRENLSEADTATGQYRVDDLSGIDSLVEELIDKTDIL